MRNRFFIIFISVQILEGCINSSEHWHKDLSTNNELRKDLKAVLFSDKDYKDQLRALDSYKLQDFSDSIAYGLGRTLLESKYSKLSKKTEALLQSQRLLEKAKEDSLDYINFNFIGFAKEAIERPINLSYFAETVLSNPEFFGVRITPLNMEPIIIGE